MDPHTYTRKPAEVYVLENPDGIFIAQVKGRPGLQAEGASAQEAEERLEDLLDMRKESGEILHRQDIPPDPDEAPEED